MMNANEHLEMAVEAIKAAKAAIKAAELHLQNAMEQKKSGEIEIPEEEKEEMKSLLGSE